MFFKYYLKLVRKNLKTSIMYFLIFIVLGNIFIGSNKKISYEESPIDVVVNNKSTDEVATKFVDYIKRTQNVTEKNITENEAKTLILKKNYRAYVEIDENFKENLKSGKNAIKIIGDETSYYFIAFKVNIEKYLNYLNVALVENRDYSEVDNTINTNVDVKIADMNSYNEENIKYKYNLVFYFVSYSLLSTILFVISNIEQEFADKEVKKRLEISPVSNVKMLLQKYSAQILTATIFTIMYLIFIYYKVGKYYETENFVLLNIGTLIHSLCTVSLANVLFNLTDNKNLLNNLINIFTMIVSFISGIFIPEEFLPKAILAIANFFPTRYYINFVNNVSVKNLFTFTSTQILFSIFFLAAAIMIKKYKTNTQKA